MGFRIKREAKQEVYFPYPNGWDTYLQVRGDAPPHDHSLCRVLNKNTASLRELATASAKRREEEIREQLAQARAAHRDITNLKELLDQRKEEYTELLKRAAFPWITPVVGTGCLSASDDLGGLDVAKVPGQLARIAESWGSVFPGGDNANELIFSFTSNLVMSRTPQVHTIPTAEDVPGAADLTSNKSVAAKSALVAALLTRLFHRIAALTVRQVGERYQQARLTSDHQEYNNIQEQLVQPLLANLSDFADLTKRPHALGFLRAYVNDLSLQLRRDGGAVRVADAQLLTEVTWHLMTRGTERYVGWSDLILLIGMASQEYQRDRQFPFLTDLSDPKGLVQWLIDGLDNTTGESWQSRVGEGGDTSDREEFYNSVADLIVEQARLGGKFNKSGPEYRYLPAVAYVTSFDLELEMALHARNESFVLVAPFEVWHGTGTGRRSSLVWFYRVVAAPACAAQPSLTGLREGVHWNLLTEQAFGRRSSPISGLPVVVRLTGCPLVQPPVARGDEELERELEAANLPTAKADFEIGHATLLVEHIGLHHWATEAREAVRLPRELVGHRGKPDGSTDNMDRRFWMLLGVQIADDAVRHRVGSLVAAESIRGLIQDAESETPQTGVVVNLRSEPAQRDIFQWQGLDVVADDHTAVVNALRHYIQHLKDPSTRPGLDETCAIGPNDTLREERRC